MAEENKIVVSLEVIDKMSSEISAIRANMESNLERQNDALKKSKTEVKSLGDELKGNFVNAIKGAVLAYAGFEGVRQVTRFFMDARKEYQESVAAQNKLRAALGYTSQALNEQADALAEKLIVDNDEITAVQAMLANYVKSDEQIRKLTPAVLDLAAATGMDMASAANMVARGIADDNGELGRFKIAVEGAKGSVERISSVIQGINKQFSGQAAALASAKDGWDAFGITWKAILEEVGSSNQMSAIGDIFKEWSKGVLIIVKELKKDVEKEMQDSVDNAVQSALDISTTWEGRKEVIAKLSQITHTDRLQMLERQAKDLLKQAEQHNDAMATYSINRLYYGPKGLIEQEKKAEKDKANSKKKQIGAKLSDDDLPYDMQPKNIEDAWKYKEELRQKDIQNQIDYKKRMDDLMQDSFKKEQKNIEYTRKLEQEKAENQQRNTYNAIALSGDLFSAIAGANERNAQEKKNIARVEALINTALAVTQVMGTPWMIPFVVATGIAQQAAIANAKFATGTPYAPGGLSLVGESGPELLNLPRGAQIYNSTQTRNMITNQGAVTINVMDNTGSLVDSMRRDIRSGAADQLVNDILSKANRRL